MGIKLCIKRNLPKETAEILIGCWRADLLQDFILVLHRPKIYSINLEPQVAARRETKTALRGFLRELVMK